LFTAVCQSERGLGYILRSLYLTAIDSTKEAGLMGGIDDIGHGGHSGQGLCDHVSARCRIFPVGPMGESFCVLHRIAPVVGVSVIGKDLEVDAIIRKNK